MCEGHFGCQAVKQALLRDIEQLKFELSKEKEYGQETHARFEYQNDKITKLEFELAEAKKIQGYNTLSEARREMLGWKIAAEESNKLHLHYESLYLMECDKVWALNQEIERLKDREKMK